MKNQIDKLVQEWVDELDHLYKQQEKAAEIAEHDYPTLDAHVATLERHIKQIQKLERVPEVLIARGWVKPTSWYETDDGVLWWEFYDKGKFVASGTSQPNEFRYTYGEKS